MPRRLPPHVQRQTSKAGQVYLYFRRGHGERIRLPADLASDEFRAAYAAALAGQTVPENTVRPAVARDSLAALITDYIQHGNYRTLRATTRKGYASRLETLRKDHGHRTVSGMERAGVLRHVLDPYAGKPGAQHSLLKMLRILIHHGMMRGWLKADPTVGIKRPKLKEIRSWTDDELAQFEARWPVGTKQRLAYALFLFTGQRRSDVHRMTWADFRDGEVRVIQQKTGNSVWIDQHPDLTAVLDGTPKTHVTILTTEFGRPFTVNGFGNWMRSAITAAGMPLDVKPHGLRKASARRLAEVGCSASEIQAVLGLKTLAEAERYTREANRRKLGKSAILKLERT